MPFPRIKKFYTQVITFVGKNLRANTSISFSYQQKILIKEKETFSKQIVSFHLNKPKAYCYSVKFRSKSTNISWSDRFKEILCSAFLVRAYWSSNIYLVTCNGCQNMPNRTNVREKSALNVKSNPCHNQRYAECLRPQSSSKT